MFEFPFQMWKNKFAIIDEKITSIIWLLNIDIGRCQWNAFPPRKKLPTKKQLKIPKKKHFRRYAKIRKIFDYSEEIVTLFWNYLSVCVFLCSIWIQCQYLLTLIAIYFSVRLISFPLFTPKPPFFTLYFNLKHTMCEYPIQVSSNRMYKFTQRNKQIFV